MKYSIIIIEERELFREGICRLLSPLPWISYLYETGRVSEGAYCVSSNLASHLFEILSGKKAAERLTSRETSIYDLMRLGKTNQEIADELHISLYTVKNHVSSIIKKMNLKNRHESK